MIKARGRGVAKQQLKALCHTNDPTERVDLGARRRGEREGVVDRVANAGNRGDPTHLADPHTRAAVAVAAATRPRPWGSSGG